MVLGSQRDGPGSVSQDPRDRTSGTRGATDVPALGQWSGAPGTWLGRKCVPKWGLSAQCDTCLAPRLGRGCGRRYRILGLDPAAHWLKERGTGVTRLHVVHRHPRPLVTQRKRKLLFFWGFGYHWLRSQRLKKAKREQKILHPDLLWGKE